MRTYKKDDKVEYHPFENCGKADIAKRGVIQEALEGVEHIGILTNN